MYDALFEVIKANIAVLVWIKPYLLYVSVSASCIRLNKFSFSISFGAKLWIYPSIFPFTIFKISFDER